MNAQDTGLPHKALTVAPPPHTSTRYSGAVAAQQTPIRLGAWIGVVTNSHGRERHIYLIETAGPENG